MGIWEAPKEAFLNRLKDVFGFEPPRDHGYAVVDAIKAMHAGKAKVFFAMGGNFISATPDTEYTAQALRNCSLTVQVSTKLNRSHLIHGKKALILPCLGRTEKDIQTTGEQFVTVENSMGVVHSSKGILAPCSVELLSEPAIVCRLAAKTLGSKTSVNWNEMAANYDLIRDAIEQVIPGFESYNKRVRKPEGFYLPNGAREGDFKTDTGKAKFSVNQLPVNALQVDEFMMMTVRSHDQYNTTIYGLDDRYRGILNERRVVMMNRADIKRLGLKQKDIVNLTSNYKGERRIAEQFVVIEYDIPKGCVATYFPEANVLVPVDLCAIGSKTPASKLVAVKISLK